VPGHAVHLPSLWELVHEPDRISANFSTVLGVV
jgi:hypothetical protein